MFLILSHPIWLFTYCLYSIAFLLFFPYFRMLIFNNHTFIFLFLSFFFYLYPCHNQISLNSRPPLPSPPPFPSSVPPPPSFPSLSLLFFVYDIPSFIVVLLFFFLPPYLFLLSILSSNFPFFPKPLYLHLSSTSTCSILSTNLPFLPNQSYLHLSSPYPSSLHLNHNLPAHS